ISGAFDSLLRVLFNFPSRYWFAIGLETYLVLEVNALRFILHFRGVLLRILPKTCLSSSTGLSPYNVLFFNRLRVDNQAKRKSTALHFHYITITDSVWTVPFSVALTNGISIDFFSCR